MQQQSISRWQQFYLDDPELVEIPASACAHLAAEIFAENNCHSILDLGCGTGRDAAYIADSGTQVIGLDAARSGLLLYQKRIVDSGFKISLIESDSRVLPFADMYFDGVYCFGLLHEFVGESAGEDVNQTLKEARRVLKPTGAVVIAVSAGDPEKGLPHVQNFSEEMFDTAMSDFRCIEKKVYDDLGCTGRSDYKVWFGHFVK
jgi:ubiquinone/menaquinone biosynthesis C-methylase UbiE